MTLENFKKARGGFETVAEATTGDFLKRERLMCSMFESWLKENIKPVKRPRYVVYIRSCACGKYARYQSYYKEIAFFPLADLTEKTACYVGDGVRISKEKIIGFLN